MNSKYPQILVLLAVGTAASIDMLTSIGCQIWVGYAFAILLCLWIERSSAAYIVATVATVLLLRKSIFSDPSSALGAGVFECLVAVIFVWITAGLVWRAKLAKLDDATRRLGAIVESSRDAILSVTPDGFVTTWNAGAEEIFGYAASEMIGKSILNLVPPHREADKKWVLLTVRGQTIHTYDTVRLTKDGRMIDVSVTVSPLRDAAGQFLGVSKIIRDISEQKRVQALLQKAHEQLEIKVQERTVELSDANYSLRELSSRLMQVQEEERSRLARDLHDEIGQLLTALKIDLQEIKHGEVGQVRADALTDSLELVDHLLTQVRTLALNLRPSVLDDLGLVPALRWYASRQANRNGWTLALSVQGMVKRVPAPIEVACFRIVQEALTNVAKYAMAKTIDLMLHQQEEELTLIIQDDGRGFDVASARQRAQEGQSIGLLSMEERVRLVGGILEISSTSGRGTTILIRFPLSTPDFPEQHDTTEVMST
ncbi:MAG: PAS domain S-box protein [Nitrospira sp.]|nr:PAS domain S-box protein [Nitrospira sp.]